jgi:hypothetical protein
MTISTPTWDTLALDQSLALRTAASRLAEKFDGIYGPETIERFPLHPQRRPLPNGTGLLSAN